MDRSLLHIQPDDQGEGGQRQLHHDPDAAHQHPIILVAKSACGRGIDIRHRDQHEEHDSDLVHLAASDLDRIAVAEFMERLDHRIDQPEHQQVRRRQCAVEDVFGNGAKMHHRKNKARDDKPEPEHEYRPAEYPPHQRKRGRQKTVRIPKRDANRKGRPDFLLHLHSLLALVAAEQLPAIRCRIANHRVGRVKLTEKPNGLVLGRRAIAKLLVGQVPDPLHRALAVHQTKNAVGGGAQTVRATAGMVLKDKPDSAAIVVAMNFDMLAKPRLECGDAVPGRGEQRRRHLTESMTRRTSSPTVLPCGSRSRSGGVHRPRSCRLPPSRGEIRRTRCCQPFPLPENS